jgi:hypothetical protein
MKCVVCFDPFEDIMALERALETRIEFAAMCGRGLYLSGSQGEFFGWCMW